MMVSHRTMLFLSALITLNAAAMATVNLQQTAQTILSGQSVRKNEGWRVSVSRDWNVLGPFPIHAREQHFLSPSFPLNLTEPINLSTKWPSSYADGGTVSWTKAQSQEDGILEVSFPNIRWESLRATEGWAALQHHNILRTTLTIYPPLVSSNKIHEGSPRLLVDLLQGSFFTILPGRAKANTSIEITDKNEIVLPEWHAGNIYGLGRSPPNTVDLPTPPSIDSPTSYELVVSGDYEIRLFGDPRHSASELPKLSISVSIDIEHTSEQLVPVVYDASHDVSPDFVGGWAFGNAIGTGLRSRTGWWTVISVDTATNVNVQVSLLEETRIAPTQTRIVPIKLTQTEPVELDELPLVFRLKSDHLTSVIHVTIPVQRHPQWTATDVPSGGIKASYFFDTSTPTAFLVTPPEEPNAGSSVPHILALHGAGVDIFRYDFWIRALPRQRHSWVIAPTGRTEWVREHCNMHFVVAEVTSDPGLQGLDWHGPSARDAWSTVSALHDILNGREQWRDWGIAADTKVLLMGHSNGGQGAWYLAARSPDRVVGVVPAAGYIKSQAYVSWVQSRSAHYIDPAIRAVLESSLTPDDNDLFLTNMMDTPILAIHGGDDDNVPVWHTREAVSVLRTLNPQANVTFREDPGEPHWYDTVFKNDQVEDFVSSTLVGRTTSTVTDSRSFTLTVSVPCDSGPLHGWSIHSLSIPGRLARLTVDIRQDAIHVRTTNVRAFSIHTHSLPGDVRNIAFHIDGQTFKLDEATWSLPDFSFCLIQQADLWVPSTLSAIAAIPPTGRLANILSSNTPVSIVVPTRSSSSELSAALRLAHNINVYHKLDTDVIDSDEAMKGLREGSLRSGNIVVLGSGELTEFATAILRREETPFRVRNTTLELRGRRIYAPSTAILFLHPHPFRPTSLLLFVQGTDVNGLERGLRLFPIRTGVTVPDWIVVGSHADERGSGGVIGAGVWGNDWSWNEPMSAF